MLAPPAGPDAGSAGGGEGGPEPAAGPHAALALAALAAAIYAVARTTGLADLGRRVDLAERSVRRGEGDPDLNDALSRDAEGDWE